MAQSSGTACRSNLTEDVLGQPIPVDPTLNLTLSEGSHETVLKPLVGAIISVFKRQFKRFLEGDLVDPTPEDIEKAQHACSHNMAAERILGLTDSMCRKAPNATRDFLSGKLRYRLNGTADWLDAHQDQELLFNFVVKESYKAEAQSRRSSKLQARRVAVAKGREDAMRKTVSVTLQQLIQNPPAETTELEAFDSISPVVVEKIFKVLHNNDFLQGQLIRHNWFEDNAIVVYYGRVHESRVKTIRKVAKVVLPIVYWKENEIEADGSEKPDDILLSDFLTDVITGDLYFEE